MSAPLLLFNIIQEVLDSVIRQEKDLKAYILEKKKPPVFTDDTTVYIENPRESLKKLLKLSEFSQVTVHKVNTQKSIALLHSTNNGKLKKNF